MSLITITRNVCKTVMYTMYAYTMYTRDVCKWKQSNGEKSSKSNKSEKPFQLNVERGECDGNCITAKELKCVCRCGGKNHGAALRRGVQPLDQLNEPQQELEAGVIAA